MTRATGALLMLADVLPSSALTPVIAVLLLAAFTASMTIDVRPAERR